MNWKIDKTHSEVAFKVKHMMLSTVTGNFEDFDAEVVANETDFSDANITFTTSINSINTRNKDRDAHLKSDDFFKAEEFPELTFVSDSYDGANLSGNLTIRGTTKRVNLNVDFNGIAVDPYGQTKAGFEITGEINRKDFGLTWDAVTEAGNIVVSDKIKLIVDAQFIQQQ